MPEAKKRWKRRRRRRRRSQPRHLSRGLSLNPPPRRNPRRLLNPYMNLNLHSSSRNLLPCRSRNPPQLLNLSSRRPRRKFHLRRNPPQSRIRFHHPRFPANLPPGTVIPHPLRKVNILKLFLPARINNPKTLLKIPQEPRASAPLAMVKDRTTSPAMGNTVAAVKTMNSPEAEAVMNLM